MAELDEMIRGEGFIPAMDSRNEFNMLFEPGASDVIMAAIMQKMMG